MSYKVNVGGRRFKHFATLEKAKAFCGEVFKRSNIVLAIEQDMRADTLRMADSNESVAVYVLADGTLAI